MTTRSKFRALMIGTVLAMFAVTGCVTEDAVDSASVEQETQLRFFRDSLPSDLPLDLLSTFGNPGPVGGPTDPVGDPVGGGAVTAMRCEPAIGDGCYQCTRAIQGAGFYVCVKCPGHATYCYYN